MSRGWHGSQNFLGTEVLPGLGEPVGVVGVAAVVGEQVVVAAGAEERAVTGIGAVPGFEQLGLAGLALFDGARLTSQRVATIREREEQSRPSRRNLGAAHAGSLGAELAAEAGVEDAAAGLEPVDGAAAEAVGAKVVVAQTIAGVAAGEQPEQVEVDAQPA